MKRDSTLEERRKILVEQRKCYKENGRIRKGERKLIYKIDLYDRQLLEKKLKGE
ncbi:MAG: hypothetical protein ACLS9A_06505 [Clostridia bacterium]